MKISGFTYVRNGFDFGYPFIEAILSILPIVDECVVVIGDSTDGTREAVAALNSPKIKIIDSVWDMSLRSNGSLFAQQSNLGIDALTGDWAVHIQADEVIHESQIDALKTAIETADKHHKAEAVLMPFLHFWGDFHYIRHTRRTHDFEIRAFKINNGVIRAYRDSQGFRKYSSIPAYLNGEKGEKLYVLKVNIPIYHYSYVRNPNLMTKKATYFHRFWHSDEQVKAKTKELVFDYNDVDKLTLFQGEHPALMQPYISKKDWDFTYQPERSTMSIKDKILNTIEEKFGIRLFSYKNYKLSIMTDKSNNE